MVRRALVPSALAVPVALAAGWIASGPGAGASAAIRVVVVYVNFGAHRASLPRAAAVSVPGASKPSGGLESEARTAASI